MVNVTELEEVSFSVIQYLKTADDKYSLLNRDNFTQPIQIFVSQIEKTFSQFLSAILISTLNFEHFQKKENPHSRCISEIKDSKKGD